MYGRKITTSLREGTPLHLYLPGPHRGVWNEEALQVSKEIILCESLIDALTFWCAGFRNVTASYGVNGFTDDHRAAFRKHGVQAGVDRLRPRRSRRESGAVASRRTAGAWASSVCVCCFRKAWTPTNTRCKVTPAAESLETALNKAQWLGKGKPPERLTVEVIPVAGEDAQPEKTAAKEKTDSPPEPVSSLAADPQPPAADLADVPTEVKGEEITITLGDRRYRVRGLAKNLSYDHAGESAGRDAATASTSIRSISTRPASAPCSSNKPPSRWA